jgi:hypothetical protein
MITGLAQCTAAWRSRASAIHGQVRPSTKKVGRTAPSINLRATHAGQLPQASWVLPPKGRSEHPAPSSPLQGAEFHVAPTRSKLENAWLGKWAVEVSHYWCDFSVTGDHLERRFAGRMETGAHALSDLSSDWPPPSSSPPTRNSAQDTSRTT